MKKRKFNARAMKEFAEPKMVHKSKPVDLITQYNRMRSIAADIYNSDFYMISSKAEQKKIETSIACISATMISMIGMEAIKNSHDCLPDDSGNGNDRSWDNLPDDSGNYTDTDKASHDAIEKMKNIAYGKSESDGVKKAATRQVLNSVYGAPSSIMSKIRKNLGELGTKSPMQIMHECLSASGNEYDEVTDDDSDGDEVKKFEVNLGNFIGGPFYSDQYRALGIQYGFDIEPTLKQIEKLASYYYIQMINLVDVVDSQDEITADKYTLEPGSVFFITNKKDNSKSPVFILVYMQPYTKTKSFDISRFSIEIAPEHHTEESTNLEESTKSHMRISPMQILVEVPSDDDSDKDDYDVDFGNFADGPFYSDQYRHICQIYGFDIGETLKRIVNAASDYAISRINLVAVVSDKHDIKSDDKYYPNTGDVFFVTNRKNDKDPVFVLIYTKSYLELFDFDIDKVSVEIKPVELEESTKTNYIDFVNYEAYYNIGKVHMHPNTIIDLNATLDKIKDEARMRGIDTITFVDTIEYMIDISTEDKYTLKPGDVFFYKGNGGWLNFMLIIKDKDASDDRIHVLFIEPVGEVEENVSLDDIEFIGADAYYKIDKAYRNLDLVIDLDATLIKIKEKAKEKGIKTITFVDSIKEHSDIYTSGKYSLDPGSLFFIKEGYSRFVLFNETPTTFYYINPEVVFKNDDSEEDSSDSNKDGSHDIVDGEVKFEYTPYESRYINDLATSFMAKDDIEFIGADAYYKIDKACPNSTIIDLDATLVEIKERARAKNIKTITFVGTIKGLHEAYYKGNNSQAGSLYYLKNDERPRFILITGNIDYVNLPLEEHIDPVVVFKNDDSEDESDSVKK